MRSSRIAVAMMMVLAACAEQDEPVGTEVLATAAPPPQCSNGVDDDGDGFVDFPADWGCDSYADPDEAGGPLVQLSHECGTTWMTDDNERNRVLETVTTQAGNTEAARLAALQRCQDNANLVPLMHRCRYACDEPRWDQCKLSMDVTGVSDLLPCLCELVETPDAMERFLWVCTRTALLPPRSPMSCGACTAPPPREVRQQ